MEITYTEVTHEQQMGLVARYRLALGRHAFGAEFQYFLKRRNPPVEWYERYEPPGSRWFRETRGLPNHEAGPCYDTPDGTRWIVTAGPDGPVCVYRYPGGHEDGGWNLD